MGEDFRFAADLDENGVLLFTYTGQFNLHDWKEQYSAEQARLFGDGFDPTLPVVCDIQYLRPSQEDWVESADGIFEHVDDVGELVGRCALITGGDHAAKISAHFFVQYHSAVRDTGGEIRVFDAYEEGYAWALTGKVP